MKVLLPTIVLLILSNVFMTFAWYGHLGGGESRWSFLRFVASLKDRPLLLAVLVSWGIAFIEYLFQVPANRIGSETMTKAQLKILQEVIALSVFAGMAIFYWKEAMSWNYVWAGLCILAAVFFIFRDQGAHAAADEPIAISNTVE
jgi:uncharacterized protein (DUF486 family)